ncbi:glycosyltransferase family 4 protein [Agromyces sp. SYSU T0242]|uniref:glycosyltransferase family 4 protein n=1 Tax=Agromyces litoreus TaxID=3158561 RepID=UPI0033908160
MRDVIHVVTPGDHFSPRTGSAIPTVIDGLATASAAEGAPYRHVVAIDRSTMRPRYSSASVVEYSGVPRPNRNERYVDLVRGVFGRPRAGVRRYYGPAADAVRRHESAIVVAHNAPVLASLLEGSDHRTVLFVHNELMRTYSRLEAARVFGRPDIIICVSSWLAERVASRLPHHVAARIRVVPNGVDTIRFAPRGDRRGDGRRTSTDALQVLFVGRTIELKGPDVLLRAAALLRRPDIEFTIIGSHGFARDAPLSSYEHELREIAQTCRSLVRFVPFVDRMELPHLIREHDVQVVPSVRSEASGLTAREGMASGLAVIASRVGGLPEVVGDAGMMVDPGDPNSLAAALSALADDRERLQELQRDGRCHALEHDWNWAWRRFREVLDEM